MSQIKRTRMTPRGYTLPAYVCYDCGQETRSVLKVYRGVKVGDAPRLSNVVFVHRNGSGCHKGMTASEVFARIND